MTDVYATVGDVTARWRAMSDSEETRCTALLADASDLIRTTCPNWQAAGEATLRRVTCAVAGYVAPLIANGFGVAYNPVRQSR